MRGLLFLAVFTCLVPLIVFKSAFIGILMWFWLSLMNPHMIFYGPLAGLNYAFIVAVTTLVCWLISRKEPKLPPLDMTTVLILLMMVWISVTSLFGIGPEEHISEQWQRAEKMLLMTLVAYAMTTTRQRLDHLVLVCVLSLAFFGLRGGVIAILTGGARIYGPSGTMIGDNNDLGVALTMTLPLLFYLRQRYPKPYLKWPMLGLIGLTLIAVIFTYSRGAFLALCVIGCGLWLRSRQKLLLSILIIVAVAGILNFTPERWADRMATIETYDQDASALGRLHIWQLGWAIAMKHPVAGGGFRWSFDVGRANHELEDTGLPLLTKPRAPHSIWFEMLGDHGFVGLGLFIAVLVAAFVNTRWLARETRRSPELLWANNLGRMLQVALVGFAAGGSFVSLAFYDGFYALFIIAAAARRLVAAELVGNSASAARIPAVAPLLQPHASSSVGLRDLTGAHGP